jgi:hypothetical protein
METDDGLPGLLTDRQGKPRVFYHGTPDAFTEFDPAKVHDREGAKLRLGMGPGLLYFSNDPRDAARYAWRWNKDGAGANIHPVHLIMRSPLVMNWRNRGWLDAARNGRREYGESQRLRRSYPERMRKFISDVKAEGYDGIICPEQGPSDDGLVKMSATPGEYIVFEACQVVSVFAYRPGMRLVADHEAEGPEDLSEGFPAMAFR